jgi:hypothetical protein
VDRDLELLILKCSVQKASEGRLLFYEGKLEGRKAADTVDLALSNARLTKEKLGVLEALNPPLDWAKVEYFTADLPRGGANLCRSQFEIGIPAGKVVELHLSQSRTSSRGRRDLDLESKDASAEVSMISIPADEDRDSTSEPGCLKTLRIGGWEKLIAGNGVDLETTPGSRIEIRLFSGRANESWEDGLLRSILMPALEVEEARVVRITADHQIAPGPDAYRLWLRNGKNGSSLRVKEFALAESAIQLDLEGRANAQKDGKDVVVTDLLELFRTAPILASICVGIDAALLAWVKKQFAKSGKPEEHRVILP